MGRFLYFYHSSAQQSVSHIPKKRSCSWLSGFCRPFFFFFFFTFRIRRAKLYQIAAFRGLKTPVLKRQVGNERVKRPNRENNNNGRSPSPQPTCEVHVRALPLLGTTHRYSLGMRRLPMCLCFTIKGMTSVPRGTVGRRARAFLPPSPLPLPMSVCRRMERESPIFLLFCDQHFFPNRSSFM